MRGRGREGRQEILLSKSEQMGHRGTPFRAGVEERVPQLGLVGPHGIPELSPMFPSQLSPGLDRGETFTNSQSRSEESPNHPCGHSQHRCLLMQLLWPHPDPWPLPAFASISSAWRLSQRPRPSEVSHLSLWTDRTFYPPAQLWGRKLRLPPPHTVVPEVRDIEHAP